MLLSVRHTTELSYDARISETVMELRVTPRNDEHQTLRGFGLAVGPAAPLHEHVDWLGNRVHLFSVVEPHDRLVMVAHACVETRRVPPRLEDADDEPTPLAALDHRMHEWLALAPSEAGNEALAALARRLEISDGQPAVRVVRSVTERLREALRYQKGVTNSLSTVAEVLEQGAGVCQDFSHVALALLRRAGIPGRYVSGYLFRPGAPEVETHAWVEAWVPGLGWVAVDPTHGTLCDEHHVAVAIGRNYADVPPNRGVFKGTAEERIQVAVVIEQVESVPRGLLAPLPSQLDVRTYVEAPRPHVEAIDYQQEQQQQGRRLLRPPDGAPADVALDRPRRRQGRPRLPAGTTDAASAPAALVPGPLAWSAAAREQGRTTAGRLAPPNPPRW